MRMQDIKDTFYAALRDRLAANNPGRTIALRGVTRPAVLVLENELPGAAPEMTDVFCLGWKTAEVDAVGLVKLSCEIHYATAGSAGAGGMDRGRFLAEMDEELRGAINALPQTATLQSFAEIQGGGASTATALGTNVFWSSVAPGPTTQRKERLERTATVEVFGYE